MTEDKFNPDDPRYITMVLVSLVAGALIGVMCCGCDVSAPAAPVGDELTSFRESLGQITNTGVEDAAEQKKHTALLEEIRDGLSRHARDACPCEDCECDPCECGVKAPEGGGEPASNSSSSSSQVPITHRIPVTIEGVTYELEDYIADHYVKRWTYSGPDTLMQHVSKHGTPNIPIQQLEGLNNAALVRLHSALHEAGVPFAPNVSYSSKPLTRQQPVRVINTYRYQQYCPNGVCPQR